MFAYLRKSPLPSSRPSQKRSARPLLENLEDRLLLYSAYGGTWVYGSRITYSFMPDGTSVGGTPSALFQTMNAKFATATWELQFQKAAAVWQAVALYSRQHASALRSHRSHSTGRFVGL